MKTEMLIGLLLASAVARAGLKVEIKKDIPEGIVFETTKGRNETVAIYQVDGHVMRTKVLPPKTSERLASELREIIHKAPKMASAQPATCESPVITSGEGLDQTTCFSSASEADREKFAKWFSSTKKLLLSK